MQTDFITFGEAIQLVGFKKAAQMLRQTLGIKKPLAPWPPSKPNQVHDAVGQSANNPT